MNPSERQEQAIAYVEAVRDERGTAPALCEIARHLDVAPQTAQRLIDRIRLRRGWGLWWPQRPSSPPCAECERLRGMLREKGVDI